MTDRPTAADAPGPDRIALAELDRLALAVTDRFAPYLHAAVAAVREAEHDLAQARAALARAEQAAANTRYVSDPLVFMRVTVREELDGLSRKTTPKKVRASFRYLLARAAELAEGELAATATTSSRPAATVRRAWTPAGRPSRRRSATSRLRARCTSGSKTPSTRPAMGSRCSAKRYSPSPRDAAIWPCQGSMTRPRPGSRPVPAGTVVVHVHGANPSPLRAAVGDP